MKTFSERCGPFLEHLAICGGCTGEKRKLDRCKYALECAVSEVLAKKGLVRDSKELLLYSTNNLSKPWYLPEGCNNHRDVGSARTDTGTGANARTNIGPCTAE